MVTSPSTMSTPTIQAACSLTTLSHYGSTLRNVGSRVQEVGENPETHPTNQQVPGQQPSAGLHGHPAAGSSNHLH